MKLNDLKGRDTLALSEVGRHPLLQPEAIDGILSYFPQRPNTYPLARYMPLVEEAKEKVEWDIEKSGRGGMTPAVSRGSESPLYGNFGRGRRSWEPAEFREKVHLDELDLAGLRKIGTKGDMVRAQEMLQRKFGAIEIRLLNRLEWMRRQMLFDGAVTATMPDGQQLSVDYVHPSYLERTLAGGNLWSDYANSSPLRDLQEWSRDFLELTEFLPDRIVMGHDVLFEAMQNSRFEDMAKNFGFDGDMEAVRRFLVDRVGVPAIETWSDKIAFRTELTATAANGATTVTLHSVDELSAGDVIVLKSAKDHNSEKFTVSSVSGNTVTLGSAITRTGGYSAGDPVKYSKHIIPKDHVTIFGRMTGPLSSENSEAQPDMDKLQTWGDVCSTLSYYENFNGTTGVFQKTIDNTDQDPPHWARVLGIRALPRNHYPEAWFFAKVL